MSEFVTIRKASGLIGRIVKQDTPKQVVTLPVLIPGVEDSQGDIMSVDEVEASAWQFAKDYAAGEAELGLDHKGAPLSRTEAAVVESWTEKSDTTYGDVLVPRGTWMVSIHLKNNAVWDSVQSGERSGASIDGTGFREPIAA